MKKTQPGWSFLRPAPSDAEIEQNESFLAGLKSELKQTSAVPCFKHFCRRCSSLHYIAKTEPINPRCCGSIMAYRGHATAVPAKLIKGQYQEDEV